MTIKRLVSCAAATLAVAFPAAAIAQRQTTPPDGDNYLCPVAFSDFSHPGRFPSQEIGFIADTTTYTTQTDLFNPAGCGTDPGSGGPREPTGCGNSSYGNTVWAVFYSDRWGVMHISTAGPFDSVIGVIPFASPANPAPDIQNGACYDRLSGFAEDATGLVAPRQWYAVQVGGTGTPQGGQVQVKFKLDPPPAVDGQAFLFWKLKPLRISDMYVKKVPGGERLTLTCTKGSCKKKTVVVKGKRTLGKAFRSDWTPGPAAASARMKGASAGSATASPHAAFKALVHSAAAKKIKLLKNQKVKPGTRIELRIARTGFIGKYYVWKVKKNSISSAKTRCLNPGSNTPHKKCHG
jgi:hypothetical protein